MFGYIIEFCRNESFNYLSRLSNLSHITKTIVDRIERLKINFCKIYNEEKSISIIITDKPLPLSIVRITPFICVIKDHHKKPRLLKFDEISLNLRANEDEIKRIRKSIIRTTETHILLNIKKHVPGFYTNNKELFSNKYLWNEVGKILSSC